MIAKWMNLFHQVLSNDGWNGEPVGYAVAWRALGGAEAGVCMSRGATSDSLVLDGLPPATRFAVAVRACTRAGLGPPTPSVSAATLDAGKRKPRPAAAPASLEP